MICVLVYLGIYYFKRTCIHKHICPNCLNDDLRKSSGYDTFGNIYDVYYCPRCYRTYYRFHKNRHNVIETIL